MNYLAHTLLAGTDPQLIVGGVLGDFWRGAPDPAWPATLRAGVLLHRHIDTFTDRHALIAEARALFVPPYRRYAGILLDVYFDHLLARDFLRYGGEPLASFSARVSAVLSAAQAEMPGAMQRYIAYIEHRGGLLVYADPTMIGEVLRGIGQRVRQPNPLATAAPILSALAVPLAGIFAGFFPQLRQFAEAERGRLLRLPPHRPGS